MPGDTNAPPCDHHSAFGMPTVGPRIERYLPDRDGKTVVEISRSCRQCGETDTTGEIVGGHGVNFDNVFKYREF